MNSLPSSSVNGSFALAASAMASARKIPSMGSVVMSNREQDLIGSDGIDPGRKLGLFEGGRSMDLRWRVMDGIGLVGLLRVLGGDEG